MRTLAAILLLSCWAPAQDQAALSAAEAACGPPDARFEVNTDKSQHPALAPEGGKAVVYFVSDGYFTSALGVDGKWVGALAAVKKGSYFFVPIDPGEHHLCAATASMRFPKFSREPHGILYSVNQRTNRRVALHSLEAEPGESYYFATRLAGGSRYSFVLELELLDPDEGKDRVARAKLSTFHPKNRGHCQLLSQSVLPPTKLLGFSQCASVD